MGGLVSRTYTCYEDCKRFGYIHLSGNQFETANEIIDSLGNNIFHVHRGGTSDYLIEGNVLRTNHATCSAPDKGWCFRIYSESQKGLESLAGKLGLPLECED